MDTHLSELPTMITELNVSITTIEDGATLSILANAAVAFKGLWGNLTGAVVLPYTVSHNGVDYRAILGYADVTTVEPNVTGGWATYWEELPPASFSGVTSVSTAINATLGFATPTHEVSVTAADKVISLAAATNYSSYKGTQAIVVKNTGGYTFQLKDNASGGRIFCDLPPEQTAIFIPTDTSTAAGVFLFTLLSPIGVPQDYITINAYASTEVCCDLISANKIAMVYKLGAGTLEMVVLTELDGVYTVGTVFQVSALTTNRYPRIIKTHTDDEMVVAVNQGTTIAVYVLTVSGTTPTLQDTRLSIITGTPASIPLGICRVQDDKYAIFYLNTSSYVYCAIFDVAGYTISVAGTGVAVFGSNTALNVMCTYVSDGLVIAHWLFVSTTPKLALVSVSGTVPTMEDVETVIGSGKSNVDVVMLSPTLGVAHSFRTSTNISHSQYTSFTISGGNTLTFNDSVITENVVTSNNTMPHINVLEGNLLIGTTGRNGFYTRYFDTISCDDDGKLTLISHYANTNVGPHVIAATGPSEFFDGFAATDLVRISDNKLLLTGPATSNYMNIQQITKAEG
tara:strand:+ start:27970 stop:29676 length:1707 start_codon:yes stop_codon:yes gene_type:complete